MRSVINSLRTGDWLTRERMILIPFAVLLASVVAAALVIATLDGYLDSCGHPVGTDFFIAALVLSMRRRAADEPVPMVATQGTTHSRAI